MFMKVETSSNVASILKIRLCQAPEYKIPEYAVYEGKKDNLIIACERPWK